MRERLKGCSLFLLYARQWLGLIMTTLFFYSIRGLW
ncbi:hypothetical protein PAEVO_48280 [Paenibacillus sp. GM2FR]|nr:hypothetical protein PAEVO_48280 [Paenibacillus sp. GM2FR]